MLRIARKKRSFRCNMCQSECTIYKKGRKHRVLVCPRCGVLATNPGLGATIGAGIGSAILPGAGTAVGGFLGNIAETALFKKKAAGSSGIDLPAGVAPQQRQVIAKNVLSNFERALLLEQLEKSRGK